MSEVVKLNVGGKIYEAREEALRKFEWFGRYLDMSSGEMIDTDPKAFRHIVRYMRTEIWPTKDACGQDYQYVMEDMEYFGMENKNKRKREEEEEKEDYSEKTWFKMIVSVMKERVRLSAVPCMYITAADMTLLPYDFGPQHKNAVMLWGSRVRHLRHHVTEVNREITFCRKLLKHKEMPELQEVTTAMGLDGTITIFFRT